MFKSWRRKWHPGSSTKPEFIYLYINFYCRITNYMKRVVHFKAEFLRFMNLGISSTKWLSRNIYVQTKMEKNATKFSKFVKKKYFDR